MHYKKLASYFFVNAVSMSLTIVATAIILRKYELSEFTEFSKMLLYLGYIVPLATLSLPGWLNNNFERYNKKLPGFLILVILILSILVFLPIMLLMFFAETSSFITMILAVSIFTTCFFNIAISYIQFANLLRLYLLSQMFFMVANFANIIAILTIPELPIEYRFLFLSAGHICIFFVLYIASKIDFRLKWHEDIGDAFKWGWALILHVFLASLIVTGDRLLVENIFSEFIFGQYMILGSLLSPYLVVVTLINQNFKPDIYKYLSQGNQTGYSKVVQTQFMLNIFFGAFFSCFAFIMIEVGNFDDGKYDLGWLVLIQSVGIMVLMSLYYPYSNALLFLKRTSEISFGSYLMTSLILIIYLAASNFLLGLDSLLPLMIFASTLYAVYYRVVSTKALAESHVFR